MHENWEKLLQESMKQKIIIFSVINYLSVTNLSSGVEPNAPSFTFF